MSERKRGYGDDDSLGNWVRANGSISGREEWAGYGTTTTNPRNVGPQFPISLTPFEHDVYEVVKELAELLIRKHKDYGPLNVAAAPGGALNGLRVRIHDKTARINNLIDKGATPENESLEDSFKDLANYGIIALLVQRGLWPAS